MQWYITPYTRPPVHKKRMIDSETARERAAGMIIGTSLVLKTSLGDESPGISELLDVEVPRVLSIPKLFQRIPDYKHLEPSIASDIHSTPWDRQRDLNELLRDWADEITTNDMFNADDIIETIEDYALMSDISTFSVLRRGLEPISDEDYIRDFIQEACEILDVNFEMIHLMVTDVYHSIFRQIN